MNFTSVLNVVGLNPLMERTSGRSEILIGLIDGPVMVSHPELASLNIREVAGSARACIRADSAACQHGTFVAGILSAKRGSVAPAICPDCTVLLRPIFSEAKSRNDSMPSATPEEVAAAIMETIAAGARLLNLSAALVQTSAKGESDLEQALNHAARKGVLVVAAAGNQGALGSSVITRHPWVIPVAACDLQGRPLRESNLANSIGKRGLRAPGENITSLGTDGKPLTSGGTSAATPFVVGAMALLWSEFSSASAGDVKLAVTKDSAARRTSVVPPLLNAWGAYQAMAARHVRL